MKKLTIFVLLLVLLLATLFTFSGCSVVAKVQGKTYVSYVQASRFTAGEMSADPDFEDILIDWYGGSVNVIQSDGDKVEFKETANQELSDEMKLHWAFFDSTEYGKYYSIKYCEKGMWDLRTIRKDLTILIPKSMGELNKLSITARGECDINVSTPDISYKGAVKNNYNMHLDAEQGNINAYIKDIDSFRMIGDGDKQANHYYRRLHAAKVGCIDYVSSYSKALFYVDEITDYATIKNYAGDIFVLCDGNIRKLTASDTIGTTYVLTRTFSKLDFTAKDGWIGVLRLDNHQNFVVNMSNYTEYSSNIEYKEPHFEGRIKYVPDDELKPTDPDDVEKITHTGDTWIVGNGKDKKGHDVEVKVQSGSEVYFGDGQSLNPIFKETGILDNLPKDPFEPDEEEEDYNNNNNNNEN